MNSTPAHTPTPWTFRPEAKDEDGEPAFFSIYDSRGREVANTAGGNFPTNIEKRNAEHIVRCVNAHDELVAALRDAIRVMDEGEEDQLPPDLYFQVFKNARAALAKVKA